ncbi:putative pyrroloquinoline-quinone binding quinoprotein [Kribbella sp. VKM Ac-2569]|uniref:PQQ-binding-like beta-propeller repeat protein n=1 Tax=Kribbella sp. VKM Ac-2569 TaxID=2512220 RepID=UPI00102C01B6|nr:PQQ-binding-like beta-propeller repeat protein [Kribbella sp. VKM Ac-2569]RZT07935.1 putative pyrroloquinoline-quinone binding quinoprotein [Kribbella sp. VKM Ac-2569]
MPGRVRVVGDAIVVADGTGTENARVCCFNAADGARKWVIDGNKPLAVPEWGTVWVCVVGPGVLGITATMVQRPAVRVAGDVLPVSVASAPRGTTTSGVVGVDVRTGDPVWGFRAVATPSTERTMVTAVAESVVLATVSTPFGPGWPNRAQSPTTIALDTKTGAELWRAADVVGVSGDGNSVVVARRTAASWHLEVRDARTGKTRWSGTHQSRGPYEHKGTAGDHTVLQHADRTDIDVIRLSDGAVLVLDTDTVPNVVASDPPLLVWDGGVAWWAKGPNGFVTQALPQGSPTKGKHRPKGLEFRAAYGVGPYIWGLLGDTQQTDKNDYYLVGTIAVDRTGAPCSPSLQGVALADVSDKWLVVGRKGYVEVHRITTA